MTVGQWVKSENLQVFLELLAYIAGTRLEEWDYVAIRDGLIGTNDERDRWFDYELAGKKRQLKLQGADDPGSIVLHFRVETDEASGELVDLAFFIAQGSKIEPETPYD